MDNPTDNKLIFSDVQAEDLSGAIEAATGLSCSDEFCDSLTTASVLEGFNQILSAGRPDLGLHVLARVQFLKTTLPEVHALIGFGDSIRHKDVWAHTLQVVRQTPPRRICRWAALLHDIGKISTRRFMPDGTVTFLGHPEVGARIFDRIATRLPFPPQAKNSIRFLIQSHLRGSSYHSGWTDSAVRRFVRDAGHDLTDLLDLTRADITSKYEEKIKRGLRQINSLARRIQDVQRMDATAPSLPTGLGHTLMREFHLSPGPKLGHLIKQLEKEVVSGRLDASPDHDLYTRFLRRHPLLLGESTNEAGRRTQ